MPSSSTYIWCLSFSVPQNLPCIYAVLAEVLFEALTFLFRQDVLHLQLDLLTRHVLKPRHGRGRLVLREELLWSSKGSSPGRLWRCEMAEPVCCMVSRARIGCRTPFF